MRRFDPTSFTTSELSTGSTPSLLTLLSRSIDQYHRVSRIVLTPPPPPGHNPSCTFRRRWNGSFIRITRWSTTPLSGALIPYPDQSGLGT